ncbi:hypothetical protein [Gilvimarinus sp. DA14]|uniref:hypothetical protein n=1 Tax=Gilvimarinus sp. DA14 TaxID=2956798 RepID=UPI0020B8033C|nr:hypothetical protein [Gilvimarinus sp. DA14]UTF60385.1 hypothetical protein NHM04_00900 [Gilvimarinus sp. DA14]
MKKCYSVLMTLLVTVFSLMANAHPHHDEHTADHIHFSVGSFALVAFMLVGYWVVSRYLRGRNDERSSKVRDNNDH